MYGDFFWGSCITCDSWLYKCGMQSQQVRACVMMVCCVKLILKAIESLDISLSCYLLLMEIKIASNPKIPRWCALFEHQFVKCATAHPLKIHPESIWALLTPDLSLKAANLWIMLLFQTVTKTLMGVYGAKGVHVIRRMVMQCASFWGTKTFITNLSQWRCKYAYTEPCIYTVNVTHISPWKLLHGCNII